ncbi:hypothetical protein [Streptomyces capparidis]
MTSTPRRGPLGWLRALFGGTRPAEPPVVDVPEINGVNRVTTVTFDTPALGSGFCFQVEVRCDWCAQGRLDIATLSHAIDVHQAAMPHRLAERVRDAARQYEPFHVEAAERAVNEALEDECFDNGLVTCHSTAYLRPAPEVLEQQRQAALELQRIEHRYAKSALQVRLLEEVCEQWRSFLARGLVNVRGDERTAAWLTPWAVLFTEQPDQAATGVAELFSQRREQFDQFIGLLGRQVKEYEAQDLFDFVAKNERQLAHAMQLFGLPTPEEAGNGPDDPLSPSRLAWH